MATKNRSDAKLPESRAQDLGNRQDALFTPLPSLQRASNDVASVARA